MLKELKDASNLSRTENGAVTYSSTQSDCLDLFATAGAFRHASDEEIEAKVVRACAEDLELGLRTVFYVRDIRGGLGERRLFRTALKYLAENHTESLVKNLRYVPEFGRFDDLWALLDTPCESAVAELVKAQFEKDMTALSSSDGKVSLLGKWLPSANTSSRETVRLARRMVALLGLAEPQYRKALVALRKRIKIIENDLRAMDYTFDYSAQPSRAMLKYRKAFLRNDTERYNKYLEDVASGKAKLNTGALTPHDIVEPCIMSMLYNKPMPEQERRALDVSWNALGDYVADGNALAVVDGSGSMYNYKRPSPAGVAQSLGIYFAEHAKGEFGGHFITFSKTPQLVKVKGKDIYEKVKYCMSYDECSNTNIARVFDLILDTAVKHKISQKDMPSALYIISDMEFDVCANDSGATNFENAKTRFAAAGYSLPTVVFWNVDSRTGNMPVTMNESGVILVSGSSPSVFAMLKSGSYSPYSYMLDVLSSPRYAVIKA